MRKIAAVPERGERVRSTLRLRDPRRGNDLSVTS
jgi:hypothetical protein